MALSGLAFVLGSLVALQDRRRAGIIFLVAMPAAAFCLAYPSASYLVWTDGGGWFETPTPVAAIGLAVLLYAPFLVPLWMWRRKARAVGDVAAKALVVGALDLAHPTGSDSCKILVGAELSPVEGACVGFSSFRPTPINSTSRLSMFSKPGLATANAAVLAQVRITALRDLGVS